MLFDFFSRLTDHILFILLDEVFEFFRPLAAICDKKYGCSFPRLDTEGLVHVKPVLHLLKRGTIEHLIHHEK